MLSAGQFKKDYGMLTLIASIAYYTFFFLVMLGIVYILVFFQLSNFKIVTQVEGNTVSVIGGGLDGTEKFRFIIGTQ